MQIQLRWSDPKTGLERHPTLEPPIAFGRTFGVMPSTLDGQSVNRMVLDDPQVEDYHAVLELVDGRLQISDRGSRTPTKVNGVALPYQPVTNGDRIQIGPFEIRIAISAASAPSATINTPTDSSSPEPPSPLPPPPLPPLSPSSTTATSGLTSQPASVPTRPPSTASANSDALYSGLAGISAAGTGSNASEQFGSDGTCDRKVGFLFKRRCGRTTTEGCEYCQNGRQPAEYNPYADDYGLFPGYGYYGHHHWGYHYYSNRDRYYYDPDSRRVDFTEADGESFEDEADQGYEMDLEAS